MGNVKHWGAWVWHHSIWWLWHGIFWWLIWHQFLLRSESWMHRKWLAVGVRVGLILSAKHRVAHGWGLVTMGLAIVPFAPAAAQLFSNKPVTGAWRWALAGGAGVIFFFGMFLLVGPTIRDWLTRAETVDRAVVIKKSGVTRTTRTDGRQAADVAAQSASASAQASPPTAATGAAPVASRPRFDRNEVIRGLISNGHQANTQAQMAVAQELIGIDHLAQ
jgi:hypothetical protein